MKKWKAGIHSIIFRLWRELKMKMSQFFKVRYGFYVYVNATWFTFVFIYVRHSGLVFYCDWSNKVLAWISDLDFKY